MADRSDEEKRQMDTANKPVDSPVREWLQVIRRFYKQLRNDNIQLLAAGIAFYFFLSIFPAIAAFLSIYGLINTPTEAAAQIKHLEGLIPNESYELISNFADRLARDEHSKLGWGMAASVLISIWSANKGTNALFKGLNTAYNQVESRPLWHRKLLTLGVTLGGIVVITILLALIAVLPALRKSLDIADSFDALFQYARWPFIVVLALFVLGVLYMIAPNRSHPKWRWITPGSIVATLLWLLGSVGLGKYAIVFGDLSKTYGSIAAIAVLMLWFFITALAILIGAAINGEGEARQKISSAK